MVIDNKYNLGDIVYLITDEEQEKRIVTQIKLFPGGLIYQLAIGNEHSEHYEIEISKEKQLNY